jgi:malonate-semialdehyde dehydrogenase (acetylating)/methylmalonate-semialdehyde dehydrogenase
MPNLLLQNYVDGQWITPTTKEYLEVRNPATEEILAEVPLSTASDLTQAVKAAKNAFPAWRATPPAQRVQYLFKFKQLLEEHFEEISRVLTIEHGKTLPEARGSVRRGIECVDVATGAPSLLMGESLEDVSGGIDCEAVRQPMGVFACIAPFNFPAMVPLWFYPFAVACGNTFICKPSEQVPMSQKLLFELIHEAGFPKGVLNLVNGAKEVVKAMVEDPDIVGISFVGSSPVARYVYAEGAARGKRVQALGGAKNFIVVMPDASREETIEQIAASAYGCAGERCLAASVVLNVGEAKDWVRDLMTKRLGKMTMGNGLDSSNEIGPVISAAHREKVLGYIEKGIAEGAELLVDGRENLPEKGFFVGPTLFDKVAPSMVIAQEEIFGPVLSMIPVKDLDEALAIATAHPQANATSIFTQSGKAAREFKYRVHASMTGVNIGVAAPMSYFSFGGAKDSFFGDLKGHGRDAFDFYTDRKVVISRWF